MNRIHLTKQSIICTGFLLRPSIVLLIVFIQLLAMAILLAEIIIVVIVI